MVHQLPPIRDIYMYTTKEKIGQVVRNSYMKIVAFRIPKGKDFYLTAPWGDYIYRANAHNETVYLDKDKERLILETVRDI